VPIQTEIGNGRLEEFFYIEGEIALVFYMP